MVTRSPSSTISDVVAARSFTKVFRQQFAFHQSVSSCSASLSLLASILSCILSLATLNNHLTSQPLPQKWQHLHGIARSGYRITVYHPLYAGIFLLFFSFLPRLSIVTLFVRFLDDRRARGALPDHGLLTFQDTVKPALCLQPEVNLMPGAG